MRRWIILFSLFSSPAWAQAWQETPEWKFVQSLTGLSFQCNLKADLDHQRLRYGQRPDGHEFGECADNASKTADAQFKSLIRATQFKPNVKAVYAKWITYSGSVSAYAPPDRDAKKSLDDAVNDLRMELQSR